MTRAVAFAPASVANVAVGFDILGFSAGLTGDRVMLEKIQSPHIEIHQVTGLVTTVPKDPAKNTATAGLVRLIGDRNLDFGFRVSIDKGIPLGSGMGGSAASAVAAIVAANALLDDKLSESELMSYALLGEAQASGSFHADNLAASLRGGITLSRVRENPDSSVPSVDLISIPIPREVYCVLLNPQLSVETKMARGILKKEISLKDHVKQSANLGGFIAGCFQSDINLIRSFFNDVIIESQRAHLIPGFKDVKKSALAAGALGCSISGAGPSVFAWAQGQDDANRIQSAMGDAFRRANVASKGWAFPLNADGAKVIA